MEMEATENICTLLNQHGIYYRCYEHPAVSTCEQARALLPAIPALETKNLFLRDKNGKRHFLIALPAAKNLNLLSFAPLVNASRLSFASAERLKKYLNVKPGAVTLLGLINDEKREVELYLDEEVWKAEAVQCHPLVNTATLAIGREGLRRFFELTGHKVNVVRL